MPDPAIGDNFNDGGLRRSLKSRHVDLIALGGIIGSCYFLGTGEVVQNTGPAAFLCYALGGLIVWVVMVCLGELAVAMPVSSSFVSYAATFISPTWAAGVGWSYWFNWIAYIPAECTAAGLIMHAWFPAVGVYAWALLFGLLITVVNLSHVGAFGEIEFWLALIKIIALLLFSVAAVLVGLGIVHGPEPAAFVGTKYLTGQGGIFPNGGWIILTTMVLLLVNFQGSEIVGLAAGESQTPSRTIPAAVRRVTWRIVGLYLVPVFLLVTIFPWNQAKVESSVFAAALQMYGLDWAGGLFSFVALTAALSCANSGMYGTVRSLYGLAREGLAPRSFAVLNRNAVPARATLVTLGGVWLFLLAGYFFTATEVFTSLLNISGFTGAMCWISLCWSQLRFRRRFYAAGYTDGDLRFRAPWFPVLSHLGIWSQVLCLATLAFHQRTEYWLALPFGLTALLLPMLIFKSGLAGPRAGLAGRGRFEDVFPPKRP
jgi:AAT family amino acid transporter